MKLLDSDLYKTDLHKAIINVDFSQLDNKSIFITGGLGLICSTIVDVLLVYGKVKKIYVGARNQEKFQDRFGGFNKVEYIQYDALKKLNLDIQPDYIIHGAGLASPELYTSKPVETILSNFDGVHALLEYAKNNKTQKLLYISSSEVYGKKSMKIPFKEDAYGVINLDNIRNSYAVAKRASEMICKAYFSEYGVNTVIVRPGHIYGPSAHVTDKRVSSDFAFRAARGEKLEMKSSGLQERSYCYSIDCAVQILMALLNGKNGEAYNIGNNEGTTIREMAEVYAKIGEVELKMAEPTKAEINTFNPMNNALLDDSKIRKLGFENVFSVEEGLMHTVQILKEINV